MRVVHKLTGLLTVLLAPMILLAGPGLAPTTDAQAEDAARIRDLAERVLAPVGMSYGSFDQTQPPRAQLLLGRLPADFPFDLPIPAGGRLVGSAVRTIAEQSTSVQVVIDAPGAAMALVEFYERELQARGWDTPANVYYSGWGSFKPPEAARSAMLCHGETDAYVSVSAHQPATGPTDVRLTMSTPLATTLGGRPYTGPCGAMAGYPSGPGSMASRLLPRLSAPQGVQLQPGGMAPSSQDAAMSEATANTDMPASQLEAYFAQQLRSEGWARTAGGSEGRLAWSEWQLPAEEGWYGYLMVLDLPGENRRRLSVRVESATPTASPSYVGFPAF